MISLARSRADAGVPAARLACAFFVAALALAVPPAARAQSAASSQAPAPHAQSGKAAGARAQGADDATAEEAAEKAPLRPCPVVRASPSSAPLPALAPVDAAFIRDRVHQRVGGVVSSVCRTPFGLYEVIDDGDVFYVDERANFLLNGSAFDIRTKENLTAARLEDVQRIDFKSLPLDLAVKIVHGNGARQLAIFEDPNCPYCKRLEGEIANLKDTTIYTFLLPILSRDPTRPDDSYTKSRAVWCSADRAAAWHQTMVEGKHLVAPKDCKHPLEEILALGQKLHVNGTPTLIFADGRRAPGLVPMDKLEQMLAQAAAAPAAH